MPDQDLVEDAAFARKLGRVFLALVGLTWLLIVFGALVRAHGAGLACPDWPYCFGSLLPRLDFRVLLEWGHRAVAGTLALMFAGASIVALRRPAIRAAAGGLIALAAVVLAVQVILGGLTVLHLLASWSVVAHLLTGNLFCVILLLISRRLLGNFEPVRAVPGPARALALLAVGALAAQMVLGGLVSSNYAGLACPDWPACRAGAWFPTFEGLVGLQLAHRLGAYAVAAAYLALALVTFREPLLGNLARIALSVVLFQVLIGVANVLARVPVELTALHSANATLLVLLTALLAHAALARPARAAPSSLFAAAPDKMVRSGGSP